MREEHEYVFAVLLTRPDHYAASGSYVYRASELPVLSEVIEVEELGSGRRVRARVTRLAPESDFQIGARIERPWPVG